MTGLLSGKSLLVTGVLTRSSIAFEVARQAQDEGARIVLAGHGRMNLVRAIARRLPDPPPVLELDVTDQGQLESLAPRLREHTDGLDGVVHAVAHAPREVLGGRFLTAPWPAVAATFRVSTYSLQALTVATMPLLRDGSSIVGLDFDASTAWPRYDWMGVAKAGLESTARYLARDLGPRRIRVNLVAAGPLLTVAARGIGYEDDADLVGDWPARAPLGWEPDNCGPVARTVLALLSDWMPCTTGEIVHADGGYHAVSW